MSIKFYAYNGGVTPPGEDDIGNMFSAFGSYEVGDGSSSDGFPFRTTPLVSGPWNTSGITPPSSNIIVSLGIENANYEYPNNWGYNTSVGQSFTGDGSTVYSAHVLIKRVGNPTGDMRCYLTRHQGTYGVNSYPDDNDPEAALGYGNEAMSDLLDISNISTSPELREFVLYTAGGSPNRFTLVSDTYYCLDFVINNYSYDDDNYISFAYQKDGSDDDLIFYLQST